MNSRPIQLLERTGDITVTLGPGHVRYLNLEDFIDSDLEQAIDTIRKQSETPEIKYPGCRSPYHFSRTKCVGSRPNDPFWENDIMTLDPANIISLAKIEKWDGQLRLLQKFVQAYFAEGLPSWIYCSFHEFLRLEKFALEECLKAWVKEALGEADLLDSYRKSPEYFVVAYPVFGGRRYAECLFHRTSFVREQLQAIEQDQVSRSTARELELLRKSKFNCFVYLIEDLRNKAFKIGRSKTPGKRERTLQSEMPQQVMRFSIPAGEIHEKQLHEHFLAKKLRGEWFALTNDDVVWIIEFLKSEGDASRVSVDYSWLGNVYFKSTHIERTK